MLEKLITDLKKSLPEGLRKKLGGAEEFEEEQEVDASESEDSEAGALSDEEEKKKKQRSMIIKVIIICVLGYLAIDEFVLKQPSEPTVEELLAQAPKKSKRPKPNKPAADAAATNATTPGTDASATPTDTTASTDTSSSSSSDSAPIENVNVLDKSSTADTSTTTIEEPTVTETRVETPNVDQRLDQLVENVEQTAPSNPVEEVNVPSKSQYDNHEATTSSAADTSQFDTPVAKETPSMASKIVEGVTETAPPAYDQVGRGLVYNCKDKYWACLDKPAYVTCNKNMKWNQSKGNSAECVVSNIYSSEEDCAKVQKYNVSTSASTAFCQN